MPFGLFEARRCLVLVFDRGLPQLEQDELALRIEAETDEAGAEQGNRLRDRSVDRRDPGHRLGIVVVEAFEELLGLGREERDLFLLHEHAENRGALARLDEERPRTGDSERARAERVDRVELDDLGHHRAPPPSDGAASDGGAGAAGTNSSRVPVSLYFSSMTPKAWNSSTVTDAAETLMRWNRSRCIPA